MATIDTSYTPPPVTSQTGTTPTSPVSKDASTTANGTLAGNFQTFLTLLTTQLQNQNPMDPLDTNQFTQQLVQFAQVEQQLKQNDQLGQMIALEKSSQSAIALGYVGLTVSAQGQTTQLTDTENAKWTLSVPKTASVTVNIKSSTGQTVHTGNYTMNPGQQGFVWDGKDASGNQWPAGAYTISVTGKDATGAAVTIGSEVSGTVDSVDMSKTPPVLTIGTASYSMDKITKVTRPGL
ncbi:MAG: flagellar biosynthesis protein FlgD [Xanthobacteraceae bacterium]|nr:flagellar biosynthesis protein FlgD [Xanthobacteraceae bacterium]